MFSFTRSPSLRMRWPRSVGVMLPQGPLSNAARAAITARSTSAASPSGAVAHTSPFAGLMLSKLRPDAASSHCPLMKSLRCCNPVAAIPLLPSIEYLVPTPSIVSPPPTLSRLREPPSVRLTLPAAIRTMAPAPRANPPGLMEGHAMKWASSVSDRASLDQAVGECVKSLSAELGDSPADLVLAFPSAHHSPALRPDPRPRPRGPGPRAASRVLCRRRHRRRPRDRAAPGPRPDRRPHAGRHPATLQRGRRLHAGPGRSTGPLGSHGWRYRRTRRHSSSCWPTPSPSAPIASWRGWTTPFRPAPRSAASPVAPTGPAATPSSWGKPPCARALSEWRCTGT